METPRRAGTDPVPLLIRELSWGFARTRVLLTAVQLGVFSHLAAGLATPAEVAAAAGASERGTRMLLDALVALELLGKDGGRFRLSPESARFLVRDSPDYLGHSLERDSQWEAWSRLTDSVRSGQPPQRVDVQEKAESYFPALVRSLHVTNRAAAQAAARVLVGGAVAGGGSPAPADRSAATGLRVLDLACGSGVWGISLAEADPAARVTAQDFPAILELTREFAARHGVADRFDYLPGDRRQVELGEARYELAVLGHIVHSEGEEASRALLRRVRRALAPGGRVAIADMVPRDDRSGPPFPLLFALNMLVHTERGDVFTLAQYREWLAEAGFVEVEAVEIGSHSPLVVARRG